MISTVEVEVEVQKLQKCGPNSVVMVQPKQNCFEKINPKFLDSWGPKKKNNFDDIEKYVFLRHNVEKF